MQTNTERRNKIQNINEWKVVQLTSTKISKKNKGQKPKKNKQGGEKRGERQARQ